VTVRLDGSVVVLATGAAGGADMLARRMVAEGATVVLVGEPGERVGVLVAELAAGPGRVAVFDGDASDDTEALVEFVAELFG
jgi:NADP-dependent 3-hydroxy acid dehydrogenase YdfG